MAKNLTSFNIIPVYISIFLMSYFISVRDVDIGTDTLSYISIFNKVLDPYYLVDTEILFFVLNKLVGYFTADYRVLFFFCALLSFFLSWFMIRAVTPFFGSAYKGNDSLFILIFSIFLLSPFFFNANVNVLRQGLATPILLSAFFFLLRKSYFKSCLLFLLSIGFHKSSLFFVVLSPLVFVSYKKIAVLIMILSFSYVSGIAYKIIQPMLSAFGFGEILMEIQTYGSSSDYKSGIRIDFFLFSLSFVLVAYICYIKSYISEGLLKILMVLFVPFLLFGYVAYSDRLLLTLWYMIPVVLIIPFIKYYDRLVQKRALSMFFLSVCTVIFIYRLF